MDFLISLPFPFDRMFSCHSFIPRRLNKRTNFLLERPSKRNRILDFFRGRTRAFEHNDVHARDRDHSQVTLIDKTSMK